MDFTQNTSLCHIIISFEVFGWEVVSIFINTLKQQMDFENGDSERWDSGTVVFPVQPPGQKYSEILILLLHSLDFIVCGDIYMTTKTYNVKI